MITKNLEGKLAFALGTGRCGTKFIYELMHRTPGVHATHERHPLNDAFHRYCKWYKLPVDNAGFLKVKEQAIRSDLKEYGFSFEASAHLSLSIPELYDHFGAKFIFMIRSPIGVVESYYRKHWYQFPIDRENNSLAPSLYEPNPLPASLWQFLGRILPVDGTAQRWDQLTQIGRLSWYWNVLNQRVADELDGIPKSHYMIIRLEDFSFDQYARVLSFLNLKEAMPKAEFAEIANRRPNKSQRRGLITAWSEQEKKQFEEFVQPVAFRFGYDGRAPRSHTQRKVHLETNEKMLTTRLEHSLEKLKIAYRRFILKEFRKRFYR